MVEQPSASAFAAKERARAAALDFLRSVTPFQRAAASLAASSHLVDVVTRRVPAGEPVAVFAPTPLEISDEPALPALALRHPLAFPIVQDGRVLFRAATLGDLAAHTSKVREPHPEAPLVTPRAVVVPGRAFDRRGTRLGRGKGFYDRGLALLPTEVLRIGFCFAGQVLEPLPRFAHDVRMHAVVTEAGVDEAPEGDASTWND